MRALVLALSVLTACGGGESYDPASDNHGYGYHYDVEGPRGLRLRFSPHLPNNGNIFTKPEFYEAKWEELKACTGLSAPMPTFLILVNRFDGSTGSGPDGTPRLGITHYAPTLMLVDFRATFLNNPDAVKHEMLHVLLLHATGDTDINHLSPLFARCAFL